MTPPTNISIPILTGERIVPGAFVAADAPVDQHLLHRPEISATTLERSLPISGRDDAGPDRRAPKQAALGDWLGVDFWNQGFTTDVARLVTAFGFATLGLHRIDAAYLSRISGRPGR